MSLRLTAWKVCQHFSVDWLLRLRRLWQSSGADTSSGGGRPQQNRHHKRNTHEDRGKEDSISGRDIHGILSINAWKSDAGSRPQRQRFFYAYDYYNSPQGTIPLIEEDTLAVRQ